MTSKNKMAVISLVIGVGMGILLQFWPRLAGAAVLTLVLIVAFLMTAPGVIAREKIYCLMDPRSFMVELIGWDAKTRMGSIRAKELPNGCLVCVIPDFHDDDPYTIPLNDDGTITSEMNPTLYFWIPLDRTRRMIHLMKNDVPDFGLISRMSLDQRLDVMEKARAQARSAST
jgi:hypothetical protein